MVSRKEAKMSWQELYEEVSKKIRLSQDKNFKNWFMDNQKNGWLGDALNVRQLYSIYKQLRNDNSVWACYSGIEGTGKSTKALGDCAWVDKDFSLKKVVYDTKSFVRVLTEAKPTTAILVDEGAGMAFCRSAMSLDNQTIVRIAMTTRVKRLFVAICIPNFHYLDGYLKWSRVQKLFHILERGKYKGIIGPGITTIAVDGAKYKNISGINIDGRFFWHGYFAKALPKTIDEGEYKEMKLEYVNQFLKDLDQKDYHDRAKYIPITIVSKEMNVQAPNLIKLIKKGELIGKKVGHKWVIDTESYHKLIKKDDSPKVS